MRMGCRNAVVVRGDHWLALPKSSSRNAHGGVTAGEGGDGKGEERKTLSLIFLLPITPLAPLGRGCDRRLGTSQSLWC